MMKDGLKEYVRQVRDGSFPTREHSFSMRDGVIDELRAEHESALHEGRLHTR
jgi:hypothetical protein